LADERSASAKELKKKAEPKNEIQESPDDEEDLVGGLVSDVT
jgi:hypothetical protein